jgi:predicted enzyme related to lactoylglutathione lyase
LELTLSDRIMITVAPREPRASGGHCVSETYWRIRNLDAALGRAKAAGVKVLNGPMPVPGGQRIVQLMDPQGAAFALVTPPT